jgi:hypothetical protein
MKKFLLISFALLKVQLCLAQWEDDIRLTDTYDTSYLNYGKSRSLVTNGDTIHVVWYEKIGENWEIFYKRSTDGGFNWESETRLTYSEGYSKWPSVSVSGSSVNVVWDEVIEGNREIFFIRSLDGGTTWEEEVRLTEDPLIDYMPVIVSDGYYTHVAWVNKDPDLFTWKIYYKCSEDGGITWGPECSLSLYSPYAYNVSLTVYGSEVHVAWNGSSSIETAKIYYRKSIDNGLTWGPETCLTNGPAIMPSICVSGSSVNIAWTDYRNGATDIFFIGSIDGGENWGWEIQVTSALTNSEWPNLAISNSVLHMVWQDNRSGYYDIYYNYSLDGGKTWLHETKLNDYFYCAEHPFITVSDSALHVIWQDYRNENYEIYYKRNPTGGVPVGTEDVPLLASEGRFGVFPNPAGRQLTVGQLDGWTVGQSAVGGRQSAVKLSIVDLYGRQIKEIGDVLSFPYYADISDLRDGVYFLRIMDETCKSGSVKFVKISD